ncbi:MAG: hypothetical protein U5K29_01755 [Acidimicrobiales bacterium]|nr:hypothetical protein [Acidimicrobiales bacterium]
MSPVERESALTFVIEVTFTELSVLQQDGDGRWAVTGSLDLR